MLLIFLTSLVWMISLAGWGILLATVAGFKIKDEAEILFIHVLLGHVAIILLGYLAHLFLPLGGWFAALLALGGFGLFAANFRHPMRLGPWRAWVLLALVAAMISLFASRQFVHGDSAYYALPAIAWTVEQPVVRGLANLDPTLGYNSSWWIVSALMSWPFGIELGVVAVSVPLLSAFGGLLFQAARRVFARESQWADLFLLPSTYLWLRQIVGHNTPSPAADVPSNLCAILAFWVVMKSLEKAFAKSENEAADSNEKKTIPWDGVVKFIRGGSTQDGALFFSFSVIAASAKISCLLLVVVAVGWIVGALFLGASNGVGRFSFYGILAVSVAAYAIHGFFLSGYPFFPSEVGNFVKVPWQVSPEIPAETVARAKGWALTFGASPEEIATTPSWRLWIEKQGAMGNILVFGSAALLAGLAIAFLAWRNTRKIFAAALPFLLPAGVMTFLLGWNLYHAPALRFAAGYAFCLLGITCAFAGSLLPKLVLRTSLAAWIVLSIVSQWSLLSERSLSLFHPVPLPQSQFSEQKTTQGETIFIPDNGFAWLGPRPSAPSFEFDEGIFLLRNPIGGTLIEIRARKNPQFENSENQ